MKNKKGYTLVELIVAIAIASILFVAIGAGTIFLIRLQNSSLENSATTLKIISLKDYIIKNEVISNDFVIDNNEHTLSRNDELLLSDVYIVSIEFETIDVNSDESNDFYKCTITYYDQDIEKALPFVVKAVN